MYNKGAWSADHAEPSALRQQPFHVKCSRHLTGTLYIFLPPFLPAFACATLTPMAIHPALRNLRLSHQLVTQLLKQLKSPPQDAQQAEQMFGKESQVAVLSKLISNQKQLIESEEKLSKYQQASSPVSATASQQPLPMSEADWQLAADCVRRWQERGGGLTPTE
jgi:hypothetical protein